MRQIVAADRSEGREPSLLSQCQGRDEMARRGLWRVQGKQVGGNLRVIFHKGASGRVELVPLLGHGQRDDMRIGRHQRRQQRLRLLRCDDYLTDRADHLCTIRPAIPHQHGVKAILRHHLVAHAGRSQGCGDDTPTQIAGIKCIFKYGSLMRAMECANAQMDHARPDCRTVIGRKLHIVRQRCQTVRRQPHHNLYAFFARS